MGDLAIFHHHFRPGGVTSVVRDGLQAVLAHAGLPPQITGIQLVAGQSAGLGELRTALVDCQAARRSPTPIRASVVPDIDYLERTDYADYGPVNSAARHLADSLLAKFSQSILWWVHNYHLGKNPVFTGALLDIAAGGEVPLLLQVHDFPEAGRPANWEMLQRLLPRPLYPVGEQIHYAVINGRDRQILIAAGVPEGQVTLLNNPVATDQRAPQADVPAVRQRLADSFGTEFPGFAADRELLLYPVVARRRKNVLEAALLAQIAPHASVVVTLPSTSNAEAAYSARVADCFRDTPVPGLFGVGDRLQSVGLGFGDVVAAADRIVNPSVQEAFGYSFVDALRWRTPLVARRLDILTAVEDLLQAADAHVYSHLWVQLPAPERLELHSTYLRRLQAQQLSRDLHSAVSTELEAVVGGELVDFSYLDVEQQVQQVVAAATPSGRDVLRSANPGLAQVLDQAPRPVPDVQEQLAARFGPAAFSAASRQLLQKCLAAPARAAVGHAEGATVGAAFCMAQYLRLLLS